MSFLENIRSFKIADLSGFVPVLVEGRKIGYSRSDFSRIISSFNSTWGLTDKGLELSSGLKTFEERTKAVDEMFMALSDAGHLPPMPDYSNTGGVDWITACFEDTQQALFIFKRFYLPYLGIRSSSIMLNGFNKNGYWSATRSMNVHRYPGTLDIIAAGMLRHGETIEEALYHEAEEEAGFSRQDLSDVKSYGHIDLIHAQQDGLLYRERFHIFDIELDDKKPVVVSPYEVEKFSLLSFEELKAKADEPDNFSAPINLVIIDFLVRHDYLNDHPEFEQIKELLYRPTE